MARPRVLRSIVWLSPEGERLKTPPFLLLPVLSPHWDDDGTLETPAQYEARAKAFLEWRERNFARAADAERKRVERSARSHEQIETEHEQDRLRKRTARATATPEQIEREKAREARRVRAKPPGNFLALDGEGGGKDAIGRQPYLLIVAADTEGDEYVCHHNGKPLLTRDCLEFILSLPSNVIIVGYGIGYDATQILRGIKANTLRRILNPPQTKDGPGYTYWGDFAIIYQQGQYLRVARVDRSGDKPRVFPRSSRTIYETLGFFQSKFATTIKTWETGTADERDIIKKNKDLRPEFDRLDEEMIRYCTLECRHLAELMTKFRDVCVGAGINVRQWSGAGWLASAMLEKHRVPKRPLTAKEIEARNVAAQEAEERVRIRQAEGRPTRRQRRQKIEQVRRPERDRDFEIAANAAYYGGRFEVSRIGFIPGPVYEYDLNSAYPAAMLDLPCPLHTRWEHRTHARRLLAAGELYLAKITFGHPENNRWCGLPFRTKNGTIIWPLTGTGWYWRPK